MAVCLPQRFYHTLSRNACTSLALLRGYPVLKQAGRVLCTPASSMKVKDCYLLLGFDWSATVVMFAKHTCDWPSSITRIVGEKQLMLANLRE